MAANPAECCIQVFCRVRPLNESEKKNGSQVVTKFVANDSIVVAVRIFIFLIRTF